MAGGACIADPGRMFADGLGEDRNNGGGFRTDDGAVSVRCVFAGANGFGCRQHRQWCRLAILHDLFRPRVQRQLRDVARSIHAAAQRPIRRQRQSAHPNIQAMHVCGGLVRAGSEQHRDRCDPRHRLDAGLRCWNAGRRECAVRRAARHRQRRRLVAWLRKWSESAIASTNIAGRRHAPIRIRSVRIGIGTLANLMRRRRPVARIPRHVIWDPRHGSGIPIPRREYTDAPRVLYTTPRSRIRRWPTCNGNADRA
jgi:hypothetical protein